MAVNDMISALAQKLGLQTTRLEDLEKLHARIDDNIRINQDKLDGLKTKVADIDAKLRSKKKEYDAAGPGIKKIIKSEFAILFRRQEQILETRDCIFDRLEKYTVVNHKLDLLIESMQSPVIIDDVDEIADELQDVKEDFIDEAESVGKLSGVSFSKRDEVTDEQIAGIGSGTPEAVAAKAEPEDDLDRMISEI